MPTNLYGPEDNFSEMESHVIPGLIYKMHIAKMNNADTFSIWGTGKPKREFMHVDDLADAILFCIENWDPSDSNSPKDKLGKSLNHLNVGTGKDISIKN